MEYLEGLQLAFPDLAADINIIGEYFNQSLWHELTLKLLELVKLPQLQVEDTLFQLFEKFINPIVKKLNALSVAKLGIACSKTQKDAAKAREFIKNVGDTVKPSNEQAYIMCRAEDSTLALKSGANKEAHTILLDCEDFVKKHEAEDIEPMVHATYYTCYAAYLKAMKEYDDYYTTALLQLVYSDLEKMPLNEQQSCAYDISIAALLGEKVYNFGELLGNPVIKSLDSTGLQWIPELLRAYNKGDLIQYEKIAQQYGVQMGKVPELLEKAAFLKQKIQLMALLNFLFNLTASNTVVSFADVAKHTHTDTGAVEHLLMKALAMGVIKGIIDQVAQTISVTWVQARVLDREEIKALAAKVSAWSDTVRHTLDLVNATSAELADRQ